MVYIVDRYQSKGRESNEPYKDYHTRKQMLSFKFVSLPLVVMLYILQIKYFIGNNHAASDKAIKVVNCVS